jgi:hypothetical protein
MSRIQTKFITDAAITNVKLANMPTLTLKGNNTGSSAAPLDLTVSQVQTLLGITTSSWQTYTPTVTGYGTVTNLKGTYKQVGDSLHICIFFTTGTVTSTTASFTIPGGFSLSTDSTNKIPTLNLVTQPSVVFGTYAANFNSGANFGTWMGSVLTAPATSTGLIYVGPSITDKGNLLTPAAANLTADNNTAFSLSCEVILA